MNKKLLVAAPLALMLCVGLAGCGEEKIVEVPVEVEKIVEVAKDYFDVTVAGGTISGKEYNHEKVEKGDSVTVVAPLKRGLESFVGWEVGGERVSSDASYTFTVDENVTLTAVYDGATVSVWDGEYPEQAPEGYAEDAETRTFTISSASALAYWASKVTANSDGTDPNTNKYSTFFYAQYVNDKSNGSSEEDAIARALVPDNRWTLLLECDIDLAGYSWTPINDAQWALNGFTFEGNGHTISNLYVETQTFTGSTSGGFFGQINNNDMTFRNVTFKGAEINDNGGKSQNLAVVIGYVNQNLHYQVYKYPMTMTFDNVNVIDSYVGGPGVYKAGAIIGRSGEWATDTDYALYNFISCTVSGNLLVGQKIFGGLIGYTCHKLDGNTGVAGEQLTVNVIDCTISDNTIVTTDATGNEAYYGFGSISSGDHNLTETYLSQYERAENNTVIDLRTGNWGFEGASKLVTNSSYFDTALTDGVTEIFVAHDIDMTAIVDGGFFEWEPNDDQIVYLVAGAAVTGLDLGENVRYISGERNDEGNFIVTDGEGNAIGEWDVATASFVAAE